MSDGLKRKRDAADVGEANGPFIRAHPDLRPLIEFLQKHHALQIDKGCYQYVPYDMYMDARLAYYDEDRRIGLYSVREFFDWTAPPVRRLSWYRGQFTLGTRVDWEYTHLETCIRGKEAPSSVPAAQRVLAQCGCPIRTFNRRAVWLVSPSHVRFVDPFDHDRGMIWNGKPDAESRQKTLIGGNR
jgi:hypothetical protein